MQVATLLPGSCAHQRACLAGHADAAAAAAHLAAFAGRSPALAAAARRLVAAGLLAQEAENPVSVAPPGAGTGNGTLGPPPEAASAAARAAAGPRSPAKGAGGAAAAQLQAVLAVALRALGGVAAEDPLDALQPAAPAAACRQGACASGTGSGCSSNQGHLGACDLPAAAAALGAAELPYVQGMRDGRDCRAGTSCAAEAAKQHMPASGSRRDTGRVGAQDAAAAHLARYVLTAPRLPAALPPAARSSLASLRSLRPCLAALRRLCDLRGHSAHLAYPAPGLAPGAAAWVGPAAQAGPGERGGGAAQGGAGRGGSVAQGLGWVDCVWALGNVLGLAVGDMTTKCTKARACLLFLTSWSSIRGWGAGLHRCDIGDGMQLPHMECCSILCPLEPASEIVTRYLQDGREVRYLQRSQLLEPRDVPGFADEVVATADALLSAARHGVQSSSSVSADAAGERTFLEHVQVPRSWQGLHHQTRMLGLPAAATCTTSSSRALQGPCQAESARAW